MARLDDDDEVIVSILSLYEFAYGVSWGPEEDQDYLIRSIASIEKNFSIANLTRTGAKVFGDLKSIYRKNTSIPAKALKRNDMDFLIASVAIDLEAVLVSHDHVFLTLKELYPPLQLEDWTK